MANLMEVQLIQNYEELKLIIPTIREVLNSKREVNISWKKTQEDIYKETFLQNSPIKDINQYTILENLTNVFPSENILKNEILLTMIAYDVEQKDYLKFKLNFNRLNNSQLTENLKTQLNQLMIRIKKEFKNIINIEERFSLIQMFYQENLLSKDELKYLHSQIKPYINGNINISIWFLEQILSYEKQNQILLCEIYEYYIQQQNQEQAQKYIQLILQKPISDLNEEEILFEYQAIKTKNEQQKYQIMSIEESFKNNQKKYDTSQLQTIIELKKELGYPIQEISYNYQKLSQNLIQEKNIQQAISTIKSCLDEIKLELLINYNSFLIIQESNCIEILGDCYRLNKEYELALDIYQDLLTLNKQIKHKNDTRQIIQVKLKMAAIYFQLQEYQRALEIYKSTLILQENDKYDNSQFVLIGQTQYNMAQIYFQLGEKQIAKQYCEDAILNMTTKLDDQDDMILRAKKLREKILDMQQSRVIQ
ncbi:unnamed protein product [Paramecium primaurelia]|uniref:Tetratricopeptide repeat protein n=1 Tax=Paramecium primaurelia TaxID=5886 RepID=A0A8S1M633_PARPR|nr:unnamed protein product [Paramecium primaurelia]